MRVFLLILINLCLLTSAWAQKPFECNFRGQIYHFQPVIIQDKEVLTLDNPEVVRLVQATLAQLQVSSSGLTLYSFLPGRQTCWNDGSSTYTRNGQESDAPGLFFCQPQTALEPLALFEALGLRAYPITGGYQLLSMVTDFGLTASDAIEMKICTSAPLKYTVTEPENGQIRVEIPEATWDTPEQKLSLSEANIEVSGGDRPGLPLVLTFRFQPFWTAKVKTGLNREILIVPEPRQYLTVRPGTLQEIKDLTSSNTTREIEFVLDKSMQFFWSFNPDSRNLKVEFPYTSSSIKQIRILKTSNFSIARYETTLTAEQSFEFFQNADQPNSLHLRLAPASTLKRIDDQGTAYMNGAVANSGKIVLDPGHGGGDPGCRNRALGVWEKDITLDICLRLRDLLVQQGWEVTMTRTDDRDVTYAGSPDLMELKARADVANNNNSDLFVSIHCNASVSPYARGSAMYWYKPEDRPLAQYLDVLDSRLGFQQSGLIQNNFAVLRLTNMPAVLVETAFLSNAVEGQLLATPTIRQQIAELLAEALGRYLAAQRKQ